MHEHRLFAGANARAFAPSDGEKQGTYSSLGAHSSGDWSWKPDRYLTIQSVSGASPTYAYRSFVTGPRCGCTLKVPVGTNCSRHN
jgi:hypothetical protein